MSCRWYIFGAGWVALVLVFVYNVTLRCFAKILVWLIILGVFLGGVLGSYALFQGASDAEEEELGTGGCMYMDRCICM